MWLLKYTLELLGFAYGTLHTSFGSCSLFCRNPKVISYSITFPTHQVLQSSSEDPSVQNLLNLKFLDSIFVTVVTPSQLSTPVTPVMSPDFICLRVELLTPFTSGLPFLLCSSFVLTLLIRKHRLVVLSFRSIVLRSQTYL